MSQANRENRAIGTPLTPRSAYWTLACALAVVSCGDGAGLATANAERAAATPTVTGSEVNAPEAGAGGAGQAACAPHRRVLAPELSNARDLGGTALADGSVACGAFFRGPPLSLTDDGCARAQELGIRTVLDLRMEEERLSTPDASCIDARRVDAALPIPYGLSAADYLNDLHETASIALAFHTFGDDSAYPIYFHCTYGRDRTGVVGALLLLALGASEAAVMDEYLLSKPNVGAYPDALAAVLDEVRQRGGAEAVLRELGISSAELAVMRQRVLVTD